jgi:hypothetical protein
MFKKLDYKHCKRLEDYKDLLDTPYLKPRQRYSEWYRIIMLVKLANGYHSKSRARIILNRIEKLYQKSI